jgi:hypothetical protein
VTWKALGKVAPDQLSEVRLQLHWAAQLLSAPGTSLLPAREDYSHTNLGWDSALSVLSGRNVGPRASRAGLVFEALELTLIEARRERASIRLAGRTMQQGLAWLGAELAGAEAARLALPGHEMPSHGVGDGGVFSEAGAGSRAELATWFSNAFGVIRDAVADEAGASAVRCWPHHFDVASLVRLDTGGSANEARSIRVGFSPGDSSYDQPYFYVTPWPYPDSVALPPLPSGASWHTEGWTGAVLTAERVLSVASAQQQRTAREVLAAAIAACRGLLSR